MKNVMLPTDFTVQSLWPVHNIVKEAGGEKICIQVVHVLGMPVDVTDLLMIKSSKPYHEIPMHFREAFELLCHKYKGVIEKMVVRFIYGNTSRVLNNHIASCKIDEVYLIDNHDYGLPFKNSISFAALMKGCCNVPVRRVALPSDAFLPYQIFSSLLDTDGAATPVQRDQRTPSAMSFS